MLALPHTRTTHVSRMLNPMTRSEQSGTWCSRRDDLIFARARETPSRVHPRPRPPSAGSHNRDSVRISCKSGVRASRAPCWPSADAVPLSGLHKKVRDLAGITRGCCRAASSATNWTGRCSLASCGQPRAVLSALI